MYFTKGWQYHIDKYIPAFFGYTLFFQTNANILFKDSKNTSVRGRSISLMACVAFFAYAIQFHLDLFFLAQWSLVLTIFWFIYLCDCSNNSLHCEEWRIWKWNFHWRSVYASKVPVFHPIFATAMPCLCF